MTMICTTGPTVLPVTMEAARGALRVDGTDLDAQNELVARYRCRYRARDRPVRDGADVGGAFAGFPGVQCWQLGVGAPHQVPTGIRLPHPVLSVVSVTYIDATGADQVLPPAAYRLNKDRYSSALTPARGSGWPATAEDNATVKITVKCGYGTEPDVTAIYPGKAGGAVPPGHANGARHRAVELRYAAVGPLQEQLVCVCYILTSATTDITE